MNFVDSTVNKDTAATERLLTTPPTGIEREFFLELDQPYFTQAPTRYQLPAPSNLGQITYVLGDHKCYSRYFSRPYNCQTFFQVVSNRFLYKNVLAVPNPKL